MNGRHEDIKIEKPETSDTDGRFAFELRTDEDWASQNLLAVEVQGPEAAPRRKSKRKFANATYSRPGNRPRNWAMRLPCRSY
jgi:hypothetical protein